jgi:glutaredoxin 3
MAQAYVDEIVKSHKVAVFSKTYCPYCVKAKQVLGKYKINDILVVELDNRDDADDIQDYLLKVTIVFRRNFKRKLRKLSFI